MTLGLASSEGVNIFEGYSSVQDPVEMLKDANKIYWSKTCFLFGTLLLTTLNFDFRMAVAIAGGFWSLSLLLIFGSNPTLCAVLVGAVVLSGQQVFRGEVTN
ncbi:MAG: hypothetical protein AAF098_10295, partial [Pseudomonadota bacterium]